MLFNFLKLLEVLMLSVANSVRCSCHLRVLLKSSEIHLHSFRESMLVEDKVMRMANISNIKGNILQKNLYSHHSTLFKGLGSFFFNFPL